MNGININGYIVKRKIGEGGMAEVYYAENRLGLPAALKVLKPELGAVENLRLRFEQEAQVMAKLSHPSIRRVLDITEHEGRPVILMEYLSGRDLGAYVRENGAFPLDMAVQLWEQSVSALKYAHSEGVIHRDVKPSNFFLTDEGTLKLLDFGIAKAGEQLVQTITGQQMGTVLYMSPEQIKDPKRVTKATDYYSLGVTFYHLVTGKPPYDVTTESSFAIQLKIVQEELDLSEVQGTWKTILARVLEKEPGLRVVKPAHEQLAPVYQKPQNTEQTLLQADTQSYQPDPSLPKAIQELVRNMISVEGGRFVMGYAAGQSLDHSDAEKPAYKEALNSFKICKYPVTQAQWQAVMGTNPSSSTKHPECPVEMVSWEDVQIFLRKINDMTGGRYRLPTEAEWTFAARGGNQSRGYKYAGSNNLEDVGWYRNNSRSKTHVVGSKQPNELGLYDMSGNVWEWCSDWYDENYFKTTVLYDPKGPGSGTRRVYRGGGWLSGPERCSVFNRDGRSPGIRRNALGFRLAAS